ncbi:hypothetical protein Pmani_038407 [Petrolisthes manimaculis]|uniref:Uncharacterized protein n=1 Tax=Petrolisthes manimaculis TaxID=1843537 RepID=A0AAE1NEG6_9EUCA|nr:hypothetical protein Pmani_038407 [Petrolisthes manimaculis]
MYIYNIALDLHHQRARILGTSPQSIDGADNRWKELRNLEAAKEFCNEVVPPPRCPPQCWRTPPPLLSPRATPWVLSSPPPPHPTPTLPPHAPAPPHATVPPTPPPHVPDPHLHPPLQCLHTHPTYPNPPLDAPTPTSRTHSPHHCPRTSLIPTTLPTPFIPPHAPCPTPRPQPMSILSPPHPTHPLPYHHPTPSPDTLIPTVTQSDVTIAEVYYYYYYHYYYYYCYYYYYYYYHHYNYHIVPDGECTVGSTPELTMLGQSHIELTQPLSQSHITSQTAIQPYNRQPAI